MSIYNCLVQTDSIDTHHGKTSKSDSECGWLSDCETIPPCVYFKIFKCDLCPQNWNEIEWIAKWEKSADVYCKLEWIIRHFLQI